MLKFQQGVCCMKTKTVTLFGGSFNPPHHGHFEMAKYLHETLKTDEVWFLFSRNWQKEPSDYASTYHRISMANILMKRYENHPFVMSDIQEKMGTHIAYEVVQKLQETYPEIHFIWSLGADSFANFESWKNYKQLIEMIPIAVLNRRPDTEKARQSFIANTYKYLQCSDPKTLCEADNGWMFMDNPEIDMSSSLFLKKLREGGRDFGDMQPIADYIHDHKIYGVTPLNIREKCAFSPRKFCL